MKSDEVTIHTDPLSSPELFLLIAETGTPVKCVKPEDKGSLSTPSGKADEVLNWLKRNGHPEAHAVETP